MPSFLKSLRNSGIAVDRYLKQSKLDKFDLSSHENYVPNLLLYDFMYRVQRSQGYYSVINQFHDDFKLKQAGTFGTVFYQHPNLLTAIQNVVNLPFVLRTNHKLSLEITGKNAYFSFEFTDKPSKERSVMEDIAWAQLLDAFHAAKGTDWTPTAIYTTNTSIQPIKDIIPKGNYRVYCKQKINKMTFPTALLFNKLIDRDLTSEAVLDEAESYTKQINSLLSSAAEGTVLHLKDISDYTNTSTRTIKRRLAEEGCTFTQLASNVFFSKAAHLLNNTDLPIKIISQQLGFTNTANFTRAFKRNANLSPEAFREQVY